MPIQTMTSLFGETILETDDIICINCQTILNDEEYETVDGYTYCQDCFDDLFIFCENCNKPELIDHSQEVNNERFCNDCYDELFIQCSQCADVVSRDVIVIDDSGDVWCTDCYNTAHAMCNGCGEVFHEDCLEYYDDDDCNYCSGCSSNNESGSIHEYGYKPIPIFNKLSGEKTSLFFGIELEMERGDSANMEKLESMLENTADYFYAKTDSSLDCGVEIVSHPASYKWLKKMGFEKFWGQVCELRHSGFKAYNTKTCGIHVHMSKDAFSTWHLYKFLQFFYSNPHFIRVISQRTQGNFNSWSTIAGDSESTIKKAKYKNSYLRTTAVNLQNGGTIEIRIFRSTLGFNSFRKNVEFCMAVYDFTSSSGATSMNPTAFKQFVDKNKKEYPNLHEFIVRKEL